MKRNFVPLGKVVEIAGGYAFKSSLMSSEPKEFQIIKMSNLYQGSLDLSRNPSFWEKVDTKTERFLLQADDILMTLTGTVGKRDYGYTVQLRDEEKLLLNQRVCRIRPIHKKANGFYLFQYLRAQEFLNKFFDCSIGGTGNQSNVGISDLRELDIYLPPIPEQKAIANLLSTWDEAIKKTNRLIQAKETSLKGEIQRIMSREAIDANCWSMIHLGELFSEVTRKVGEKKLTPYSISAGTGFVSQREKWGKDISGSQHKNYTHLKAGEFSYNKGNSKRYQQGCVYLLKGGEICVPNVFISFKPKAKDVVPEFFEHYFIADYHARELKRYISSGARSDGLLNLNKKDFFKIMVPCPSPDEQKAIAEALTVSQQEIDLLKQLADKYKTQKRGLMQKILTGEWRVKPEIVNQYMEA